MQLYVEEDLFNKFVQEMGTNEAEKIRYAVKISGSSITASIQRVLKIGYAQASDIKKRVVADNEKRVSKVLRSIIKKQVFRITEFDAIAGMKDNDELMLAFFGTELGAIKKLEDGSYFICDNEKFRFLAKFLWLQNKEEILDRWQKSNKEKNKIQIKKLVDENQEIFEKLKSEFN